MKYAISRASSSIFINNSNLNVRCSTRVDLIEEMGSSPPKNPASVEILSEKYILLDSLLFKVNPEKETAVLAVPETCIDKIITLCHSSLFAGHQGVIKTYLTISDKFFIPNLTHYLRSYIKGCHLCQLV